MCHRPRLPPPLPTGLKSPAALRRPAAPRAARRRAPCYPARVPLRRRRILADTPGNRLLESGARSLTSAELLGIVLGPGGDSLAQRLLDDPGGLARLAQTPLGQLARRSGMSRARLVRMAAALELGRRAGYPGDQHVPCFRGPAEVARYLIARFGNREVEEFGVLMLDSRGCLRRAEIISRGSATGAPVHPRDLFRLAAAYQAVSLILFHNHPSGDPEPSEADRQLTQRLKDAGAIMGIPVLDHVVIGAGRWHSFGEAGEL